MRGTVFTKCSMGNRHMLADGSGPSDSLIRQVNCEWLKSHRNTLEVTGENMTIHCEIQR